MHPLYNDYDFEQLYSVGQQTATCLDLLHTVVGPGVSTSAIDSVVERFALANKLICATKGYKGFPAHCCTSVNHVVCHGIPSIHKILRAGDIVKIDLTFINEQGYYGDSCRTFRVGKISRKAEIITEAARLILRAGIEAARPGARIGEIGFACLGEAKKHGVSIVKEFVGHGIGKVFHDLPEISHLCEGRDIGSTPILEPGMVFTIEPIVNLGKPDVKILADGWTAVSKDRSLSAQWEHTIGITETGNKVFTR
jgi:methionyl aminopeptidase